MDLALFDLAHSLDFFVRMKGQLKEKTGRRDERLIRTIVVFALTVIRSDFVANAGSIVAEMRPKKVTQGLNPSEPSRRRLKRRLEKLSKTIPQACGGLEPRLITFDAHPGNFLITPTGKAVLVDLEELRYSYPPWDLAHVTLYTSTTWDVDASFALSVPQAA